MADLYTVCETYTRKESSCLRQSPWSVKMLTKHHIKALLKLLVYLCPQRAERDTLMYMYMRASLRSFLACELRLCLWGYVCICMHQCICVCVCVHVCLRPHPDTSGMMRLDAFFIQRVSHYNIICVYNIYLYVHVYTYVREYCMFYKCACLCCECIHVHPLQLAQQRPCDRRVTVALTRAHLALMEIEEAQKVL